MVIISAKSENIPHVASADKLTFDELGYVGDGIVHLTARFGFQDLPNLPKALDLACAADPKLASALDLEGASYFLSRITIRVTDAPGMSRWRKRLFLALARNAASPTEYFGLPEDRTILMGTQIDV